MSELRELVRDYLFRTDKHRSQQAEMPRKRSATSAGRRLATPAGQGTGTDENAKCSVNFKSLNFSTLRDTCPPTQTTDGRCCIPLGQVISGLHLDLSMLSDKCINEFFLAMSDEGFDPNRLLGLCMPHLAPLVRTGKPFPTFPRLPGASVTEVIGILRKTATTAYTKLENAAPGSLEIAGGSEGGPDVVDILQKNAKKVYTALGSTALASSSLNIEGGSQSGSSDVAVSSESGLQGDAEESSLQQGLLSSQAPPSIGSHGGSEPSQPAPLSSSDDEAAAASSLSEEDSQATLQSDAGNNVASSGSGSSHSVQGTPSSEAPLAESEDGEYDPSEALPSSSSDQADPSIVDQYELQGSLASGSGALHAPSSQSGQHGSSENAEKKSTEGGVPASEARPLLGSDSDASDKSTPLPKSSGESAPSSSTSSASGQKSSPPSSASGQHGDSAEKSS
ncbi:hypothetical protein CBR_g52278 [Chara braunii]|uniref:Uncharacterized protein n=1 Tax=Chara braunii TaxID=69332 RepID=A0A388M9Y8_CHABU|nr:hypothetical protein CBR_g52278 [Chara braunii]|eukprot:GBG91391.1 hypothetical protein CBR_g52278 [Chara braunii]